MQVSLPVSSAGDLLMLQSFVRHQCRTATHMPCGATDTAEFYEVCAECERLMKLRKEGTAPALSFKRCILGQLQVQVESGSCGLLCHLQLLPSPLRSPKRKAMCMEL